MKSNILDHKTYRSYLDTLVQSRGRGVRTALASAAKCQISYFSRILSGGADLSLEQADLLNSYLGHSEEESIYFLLLVQHARAGTPSLRAQFGKQIEAKFQAHLNLKDRLKIQRRINSDDRARYYSAWYYAAVHIALGIDKYQTKEALAQLLGLPPKRVAETLEFLCRIGMAIEQENSRFIRGAEWLHLEKTSPHIPKHHANWRLQSLRSLDQGSPKDVHYSVVVSLSKADTDKIRAMSVKFIEEIVALIRESKDEELHCLCLDFFPPVQST